MGEGDIERAKRPFIGISENGATPKFNALIRPKEIFTKHFILVGIAVNEFKSFKS